MRTLVQPAPASQRKGDAREQREYVTALARGLEVIRAFAGQDEELTLAEIAKIVDLPRATVRRSLITLQALGYIEEKGRFFRLAPKVLTLAQAYLSSNLLPRVANPFVQQVSADLGESCSVSILHGTEIIYVVRSINKRLSALLGDVGSRRPAYCTSMGRVLLAHLSDRDLDAYFAAVELKALTPHTVTDEDEIQVAARQRSASRTTASAISRPKSICARSPSRCATMPGSSSRPCTSRPRPAAPPSAR